MDTLTKPDPAASDAAWARVIAAREAGSTAHVEIAAYLALFGLRLAPTWEAWEKAQRLTSSEGYYTGVALDPWTGAWLVPTIGAAQIIVGSLDATGGVSHRYSYDTATGAMDAWRLWTHCEVVDREPSGWIRHQPSNRRRELDDMGRVVVEWVAE